MIVHLTHILFNLLIEAQKCVKIWFQIQRLSCYLIGYDNVFFLCHFVCDRCLVLFLLMKISKINKKKDLPLLASPNSPVKTQSSVNKIAITYTTPQQKEDDQAHLNKMPEGKTNLKQLHHFLRNQIIIVKQKQRFISNLPIPNRFGSISQINTSITNGICLKADENCTQQMSGNMPTISLPKIDKDAHRRLFTDSTVSRQQRVVAATEHSKSKSRESAMTRNHGTRKRLSTLGSRMSSIQNSPLISNASRQITNVRQGVRDYLKESELKSEQKASQSVDVVNFSLYRQCPQLNRISLNLTIQLAKCSKNPK